MDRPSTGYGLAGQFGADPPAGGGRSGATQSPPSAPARSRMLSSPPPDPAVPRAGSQAHRNDGSGGTGPAVSTTRTALVGVTGRPARGGRAGGVAGGVGQRLLQDAVEREPDGRGRLGRVAVHSELHRGPGGPELIDQPGEVGGARAGRPPRALVLTQEPDDLSDLGQAFAAESLGLGQGLSRPGRILLDGQPGAGDVQQRHGQ